MRICPFGGDTASGIGESYEWILSEVPIICVILAVIAFPPVYPMLALHPSMESDTQTLLSHEVLPILPDPVLSK